VTPQLDWEPEPPQSGRVFHSYIWKQGCSYEGATLDSRTAAWAARLAGYDAAFFGDNHKGFHHHQIINCGTLMRRRSDEIKYRPAIGLLYADGRVGRYELDCTEDKIEGTTESEDLVCRTVGMEHLITELATAGDTALDYPEAIRHTIATERPPRRVVELLLEALDPCQPT
jgi:hypothetical protein